HYATPTFDYLASRPEVDAKRIGVMAISLGGYFAPRAAAFEPRYACCLAWGEKMLQRRRLEAKNDENIHPRRGRLPPLPDRQPEHLLGLYVGLARTGVAAGVLVHDPEKWVPFFGKDHAQKMTRRLSQDPVTDPREYCCRAPPGPNARFRSS